MENKHIKAFVGIVSAAPILFLVGMALSYILFTFFPLPLFHQASPVATDTIGWGLLILGTVTVLWANSVSRKFHITGLKFHVCQEFMVGPYKYSRHPGALSLLAMFAGFTLVVNSLVMAIMFGVFWIILTFWFVPMEEKVLLESCHDAYADYMSKVRMWM